MSTDSAAPPAAPPAAPDPPPAPPSGAAPRGVGRSRAWIAWLFLLPALVLLGALVAYPIGYSVYRSLLDAGGEFTGLANYGEIFTDKGILTALRNNLIWVIAAPSLATALGLLFAVLTERIRWATAFKLIVFMPMAISMLAAGITFRLVYEQDPERGVANAVWTGVHDTFAESSPWPGAQPREGTDLRADGSGGFTARAPLAAGESALVPLVGVPPKEAADAQRATATPHSAQNGGVAGVVWLDFVRGGGSAEGRVDGGEKALAGVTVEARQGGRTIATAKTGADGVFTLPPSADGARLHLPASNFAAPYGGVDWLGPTLVTPSIIGSYVWMWAGFAMVLIAAGLAGIPRELLEAARMDGASEWQVFRRVTVPLLAPVLGVVFVTLMINVLKIFDLVYVIAPGASQENANVLALQLYLSSFGSGADQGVGSAIAVVLLLLVVPVMVLNIRRLRRESQR